MEINLKDSFIVFIDGDCLACNRFAKLVSHFDHHQKIFFAPIGGETYNKLGLARSYNDIDSIIFYERGQCFIKSMAIVRLIGKLPLPWRILSYAMFLIPSFLRDRAYEQFAFVRYKIFGKDNQCYLDLEKKHNRFLR